MATLSRAALRRLVKLYRRGVDGAETQLDTLITQRTEELDALLAPDLDVALLRDEPNRVELLASWVENARRRNAERRARQKRELAEQLVHELVATAVRAGDVVHLEPDSLGALMACSVFDYLVPDPDVPAGIERRRLHAFLRRCRDVEIVDVELSLHRLWLRYRTPGGHGELMLLHQAVPVRKAVLYLPPPPRVLRVAEEVPALPAPVQVSEELPEPTEAEVDTPPEEPPQDDCDVEPVASRRPTNAWLRKALDLVTEALP